mgnify:CR=1 FL=1
MLLVALAHALGGTNLLDKIMAAFGAKQKAKVATVEVDEALKAKLKGLVYDDELVEQLLPVFTALKSVEGFEQVMTLLESKESQIEAIAGGEAFTQQTSPEHTVQEEEEEQSTVQPITDVAAILAARYKS